MRSRGAWLVAVIAFAIVVGRVRSAKPPVIGHPATPIEKLDIAANVASKEGAWRKRSEENFPRDHWSQRDDFAGKESTYVEEMAATYKVRLEDVLRAIDEDIHENGGEGRGANVVPCKPRPFYD